ncbi:transcription factor E2F8-like isoform X2 [Mercenaria mercenaria]|nr:transcription factor E2F8-like isoform X2 [Mercenaria mercenaria]
MSQVDNLIPEHIKSSLNEAEIDSDGEINMERVPFAKNTIRMDLKQIDRSLKAMSAQSQNKENMKNGDSDENQNRSCTPSNEVEVPGQPLTPTANLKVLFNAMSPELRHRDELKQATSDEESPVNSQDYQFETIIELNAQELGPQYGPSRKEKSLGLLCQKFLQKYPERPEAGEKYEICLDEVAKELQVERRRIYDIVNVLESVEIVSRVAKNKYAWHGKTNLQTTLAKLKALGDSEGFGEQIQRLKDYEFNRELEEQFGKSDPRAKHVPEPDFSIFGENSLFNQAALRKDKSLGIMSQKFLMLFLVSRPKTVNLDLSAKLLIGDANIDRTENAKFKTKIRRLYDIANILTSLNLIRKVHVTEIRGRKPAFKYIGPDIEDSKDLQLACCTDGCHRPTSRHSMLDCIQSSRVAKIMDSYKSIKPVTAGDGADDKLRFSRHSSFETLCAVATVETNKMNASSEPCSPVKVEKTQDISVQKKQFVTLSQLDASQIRIGGGGDDSQSKLPTKGFVRRKVLMKSDELSALKSPSAGQGTEAIIIKATKPAGTKGGKQPTVIPLTKEQIDAVLRSLKVPVPVSKGQLTDSPSQSSADEEQVIKQEVSVEEKSAAEMQVLNEQTPVITVNTPEKGIKRPAGVGDTIPIEKRVKLDFPSPCSEDDGSPSSGNQENPVLRFRKKVIDTVKPSPQRALHLAPEFVNPSEKNMAPSGDASNSEQSQTESIEEEKQKPVSKKIEIIINESAMQTNSLLNISSLKSNQNSVTNSPVSVVSSPANRTVVQLSNQPTTILQLPFVNIQGQSQQKLGQPMTVPVAMSQNVHIVQGGQQVVQLPVTFSSQTPNSSGSSPRVYTYSLPSNQSNITVTNLQLIPQTSVQGTKGVTTIVRPVATKATASPNPGSQIVPPQIVTNSPLTYVSKAPGGFIPISSSSVPKIILSSNPTVVPSTSGSVAVDSS